MLIAIGGVVAIVFAAAGGLLMWGSNFAEDYVHDELSSQNVVFPDADELREEGRDDLVGYAGETVTTGDQAEAYASFIDGHLQGIADGQTYSQIDDRGAAQAVTDAREAGASPRRSPSCRPRPTSSRRSGTRSSGARRCGACC